MSRYLEFAVSRSQFLQARKEHLNRFGRLTGRVSKDRRASPKLFSCQSARAAVWHDGNQAWRAEYSGVLTQACFAYLRAQVIAETQHARVMTLNMSRALMATPTAPTIHGDTYRINRTPGASVVRQDQFDVWRDYAGQMADLGIIRVVFLTSQLPQARRWTDRFALALG